MKMAAYPNAFRVYGDYGYGSVIFNDLKLPAVKGTPTDKPLVQVQKSFNRLQPRLLIRIYNW